MSNVARSSYPTKEFTVIVVNTYTRAIADSQTEISHDLMIFLAKKASALVPFVALLAIAGCGSKEDANKANFSTAIQQFFDAAPASCVALPKKEAPFWVEKEGSIFFADAQKRASALATAGLLSASDAVVTAPYGVKLKIPVTQYTLTDKGKAFLVKGGAGNVGQFDAFCGGKFTVKEISNFTEPSDAFGKKISEVNFQFELRDAPDWLKDPAIRAAYATAAVGVDKPATGKAVLILTNDGWMHEALFQRKGG